MKHVVWMLIALAGCAKGALRVPPMLGEPDVMRVRDIWYNPRPGDWSHSPWARVTKDTGTPQRVYITANDWACPVWVVEVYEPKSNELYHCRDGWRPASRGRM